jgi:hypothetical protein
VIKMGIETSEEPVWFYEAKYGKVGEWILVILNITPEKKKMLVRSAFSYHNQGDVIDNNKRLNNYLLTEKGRDLIRKHIREMGKFEDFSITFVQNFDGY